MSERNNSIDILKLILAYFVVFIHCPLPGYAGTVADSLERIAVPAFFIISGYFCLNSNRDSIKRQLLKILKLTAVSLAIYLTYELLVFHSPMGLTPVKLLRWALLNVPLSPVYGPLWYLFALLYCYVFLYVFIDKPYFQRLSKACLLLFIPLVILSIVLPFFGFHHAVLYRNAWLTGLPFMMLGCQIHRACNMGHLNWNRWIYLTLFIGGGNFVGSGITPAFRKRTVYRFYNRQHRYLYVLP